MAAEAREPLVAQVPLTATPSRLQEPGASDLAVGASGSADDQESAETFVAAARQPSGHVASRAQLELEEASAGIVTQPGNVTWAPSATRLPYSTRLRQRLRERAARELRYVWQRQQSYSLRVLRKFPTLLLLAVWHTYGVWLAFCAIICMAGNTFLSWYVGWYQQVPSSSGMSSIMDFPYRDFFAIFLRSWLLVHLTSELCRFCYLLCVDAWSLDAFGSYRRAICGHAAVDMWSENTVDHRGRWPERMLTSRRAYLDALCQWVIYLSLDLFPFLYTAIFLCSTGWDNLDLPRPVQTLLQALLNCSLVHVALFFLSVTVTDVVHKVIAFRVAWAEDSLAAESRNQEEARPEAEVTETSPQERLSWRSVCVRWLSVAAWRSSSARGSSAVASPSSVSLASQVQVEDDHASRGTQTDVSTGDSVAERLSQCVRLCGWLDVISWELAFAAVFVGLWVAAWFLKTALYVSLCIVGALVILYWRCRWPLAAEQEWEKSHLQLWGEVHCSLGTSERFAAKTSFGLVLILQGALFGLASQWTGLWVCAVMLGGLLVREVVYLCERNHGWWIGLCEGVVVWLVLVLINRNLADAFVTFALVCANQFSLKRFVPKGSRLVKVIDALMYLMLVLIVGATLLSVAPAETSGWSAFNPGTLNYTIQAEDVRGRGFPCEGRFASGQAGVSFSLADFALWSSLAYESPRTMSAALQHFFPGWRIGYQRRDTDGGQQKEDWTTFFEYVDPANSTSIISIRGTDTTVDVLNDINIWLTAGLMNCFEILGPTMIASISKVVADLSKLVRQSGAPERHFAELLKYVEQRRKQEPGRRFYITGHSLGGGLAKLVSLRTGVQAQTFMAPGIQRTRYTVFETGEAEVSVDESVTVMPTHDLVSRVDSHLGTVVPTDCNMDPLTCHMIYEGAICPLMKRCGSMRAQSLQLPCGQCKAMPC